MTGTTADPGREPADPEPTPMADVADGAARRPATDARSEGHGPPRFLRRRRPSVRPHLPLSGPEPTAGQPDLEPAVDHGDADMAKPAAGRAAAVEPSVADAAGPDAGRPPAAGPAVTEAADLTVGTDASEAPELPTGIEPEAPATDADPGAPVNGGRPAGSGEAGADERVVPMTPERFMELTAAIEAEVGRLMVGQADVVRLTLTAMIAGGHVLLEGVPGLGKTVLVRTLSGALDATFARVQFTPDLMPADVTGSHIVTEDDAGHRRFEFQPGPLFTNLLLADEINRATPKTQSALLEAMQERQVTVGDRTRTLPSPFFVLATQNPIELEGTYPLPEAQLDRFFFKLVVPFPDEAELVEIATRTTGTAAAVVKPVASGADLAAMAALAREVPIAGHVLTHAARLVLGTHPAHPDAPEEVRKYVRWGSSPRGLQALVLAARIRGLLSGRFNVAYEDLDAVALPALGHRVFLNFEADAAGVGSDQVVAAVLRRRRPS